MIRGSLTDHKGRCIHYNSDVDIVSYRFPNDPHYYPCFQCYEAIHGHFPRNKYNISSEEHAVLCGACKQTIAINEYVQVNHCPHCHHQFNPGCHDHFHLYFNMN